MDLSKRFQLDIPPCGEIESSPAQEEADTLAQAAHWFWRADTQIEVHHLREFFSQVPLVGNTVQDLLVWHLGKEPKSKPDRDKIDSLLVRYLAECLPVEASAHKLSFEQVAEVLRPVLGSNIAP